MTHLAALTLGIFLSLVLITGLDAAQSPKAQLKIAETHYTECAGKVPADTAATFYAGIAGCEKGLAQEVGRIWFPAATASLAGRFVETENILVGALNALARQPHNETVFYEAKAANTDTQTLWRALGLVVR